MVVFYKALLYRILLSINTKDVVKMVKFVVEFLFADFELKKSNELIEF